MAPIDESPTGTRSPNSVASCLEFSANKCHPVTRYDTASAEQRVNTEDVSLRPFLKNFLQSWLPDPISNSVCIASHRTYPIESGRQFTITQILKSEKRLGVFSAVECLHRIRNSENRVCCHGHDRCYMNLRADSGPGYCRWGKNRKTLQVLANFGNP
jgi:hypothetical protein